MKKLVTTPLPNTIWWANVNEEKGIITGDKKDVTDNAIDAVFQHLIGQEKFKETGFTGYQIPKKNSEEYITMAVFKSNTHVCLTKEVYEELKNYMRMYDELVTKTGIT
ncbi:hypothetical protein D7V90_08020 [bacterium 1xD42-87]|nr:hypothetical protein D7V90_08020 [bacterium 1xD42-87]